MYAIQRETSILARTPPLPLPKHAAHCLLCSNTLVTASARAPMLPACCKAHHAGRQHCTACLGVK